MTPLTGAISGTFGTVRYRELEGSGKVTHTKERDSGTRKFHVDWDDRFLLMVYMVGGTTRMPDGRELSYTRPQTFPGYGALRATNVQVEGFGVMSNEIGDPTYPYAEVTVEYLQPESGDDDGDSEEERVLGTEELTFGGEMMIFEGGSFFWVESPLTNKPAMTQIPHFVPTIDHVYTRKEVNVLPRNILNSTFGKVNDDEFHTVPAGRLLFAGATARRKITVSGAQPYEMTYTLKERPEGKEWNKFYAADEAGGGFLKVASKKTTSIAAPETVDDYGPFGQADFSELFR